MEPDAVVEGRTARPRTVEALASLCAENEGPLFLSSGNARGVTVDLSKMDRILSFEPEDQVVVVQAGASLDALNRSLGEHGQCIPFRSPCAEDVGTIGGLLSANRPHLLEGMCGTWRDWVLGLTLVQADGTVAKTGSKVVKSVAGYDVQKLMIGARGTLAIVAEAILKTYPLRALPEPNLVAGSQERPQWIQRVLRSDFDRALALTGDSLVVADREIATLWLAGETPQRFDHDWLMPVHGAPSIEDPVAIPFMRRAKALFDPTGKLNPGAMGIF